MTPPTGTPVPPLGIFRHNGWTPERKELFFATLAAGHSVSWGCARVGLSREAAYKARRRDREFAGQWQAAQHSAREAADAALIDSLPENLRRTLLAGAGPSEFCKAEFSPLDGVNSVKSL